MNKSQLVAYLERIDAALPDEVMLYIFGSAAFILLDEPERTSLDIDVAAPYCRVDERVFRDAAANAGLPVKAQHPVALNDVAVAVRSLPPPFNQDAVVIENLKNLRNDMAIWMGSPS